MTTTAGRASSPARLLAALLALTSTLGACGGSGGDPAPPPPPPPPPSEFKGEGACDTVDALGSCEAFAGMSEAGVRGRRWACDYNGGVSVAACPSAGDLGACIVPGSFGISLLHLYEPRWSDAVGRSACGHGAWVPAGAPEESPAFFEVSCHDPWVGTCADVSGTATPTMRLAVERACTGNDLDLLTGPCPTAGRSGTCTTFPGGLAWRTRSYDAATTLEDQFGCIYFGGAWAEP